MSTVNDHYVYLMEVYRRLYEEYGPQHWWPAESQLEVVLGAILTQSAAWGNVEKALARLKASDCWSVESLRDVEEGLLAEIIRPSGYFNSKARKLKAFISHLWERHDGDLAGMLSQDGTELRAELLSIYGIGDETADDIVLYAGEHPFFVIDSYTKRILGRLGITPNTTTYAGYQQLFHQELPLDAALYNEYHALLDRHAKEACRKTSPACESCCLQDMCATGRDALWQSQRSLGAGDYVVKT